MQILSFLLSETSSSRHIDSLQTQHSDFRNELRHWHDVWNDNVHSIASESSFNSENITSYLRAWGEMNYHAATLMLSRFSKEPATAIIESCRQIIASCNLLVRHQQRSFSSNFDTKGQMPTLVFPIDWTISHLVFSAALCLFPFRGQSFETEKVIRSALICMALMEGNPTNMSMGFSGILEGLYNRQEDWFCWCCIVMGKFAERLAIGNQWAVS